MVIQHTDADGVVVTVNGDPMNQVGRRYDPAQTKTSQRKCFRHTSGADAFFVQIRHRDSEAVTVLVNAPVDLVTE
ncbi:hypothetical protein FQZ97_791420 [compost metagenome]